MIVKLGFEYFGNFLSRIQCNSIEYFSLKKKYGRVDDIFGGMIIFGSLFLPNKSRGKKEI